jgi:hypothetical protein
MRTTQIRACICILGSSGLCAELLFGSVGALGALAAGRNKLAPRSVAVLAQAPSDSGSGLRLCVSTSPESTTPGKKLAPCLRGTNMAASDQQQRPQQQWPSAPANWDGMAEILVLRTLPAWGVFTKLVEDNIKGHPRPALSHHTTTSCQPKHSAALGAGNKAWGLDDPVKVDGQWQCRVKYPALLRAGDGYAWEYVSDMPPFMARYTNGYSGPAPVNIFTVPVHLPYRHNGSIQPNPNAICLLCGELWCTLHMKAQK